MRTRRHVAQAHSVPVLSSGSRAMPLGAQHEGTTWNGQAIRRRWPASVFAGRDARAVKILYGHTRPLDVKSMTWTASGIGPPSANH
jgi:hypothetical protein